MGAREAIQKKKAPAGQANAKKRSRVSAASATATAHLSAKPTKRTKAPLSESVTKVQATRITPSRAGVRAEEKARLARAARASAKESSSSATTPKAGRRGMRVVSSNDASDKGTQASAEHVGMTERIRSLQGPAKKALIVLAVLAGIVLALYGPARDYYVARRTADGLSSQLESINTNNDTLRSDVDSLESREGIEDAARQRGYVTEGETGVTVTGLSDEGSSAASGVGQSASDSSSTSNEPWYIQALDVFFGYKAS